MKKLAILLVLSGFILTACSINPEIPLSSSPSSEPAVDSSLPVSSESPSSTDAVSSDRVAERNAAAKTVAALKPYTITQIPGMSWAGREFDYSQYIMLTKDGKKGVASYDGEILIPVQYDTIWLCFEGIAVGKNGEEEMMYTNDLKTATPHMGHGLEHASYAWDINENKAYELYIEPYPCDTAIEDLNLYPVRRIRVEPVKRLDYVQYDVSEKSGKYGFMKNWKLITPLEYDGVHQFSEGMAAVKYDGLWGYVDESGKRVIRCQFDDIPTANLNIDDNIVMDQIPYQFSSGYAAVAKGGKWGYIDKTGKNITGFVFDNAAPSYHGKAWVRNYQIEEGFADYDTEWRLISLK